MKVAIITDSHFGCRKNSKLFHDYFEKFYEEIFFPTIDKEGIKTVVHMGDVFDSRKGIDFSALSWSRKVVFNPLRDRGIELHLIVGNHDTYYKNTNRVNGLDLLLNEYDNISVYSEATEVKLDKLKTIFIPWINQENEESTISSINKTNSTVAMGHLELNGFRVNSQITMDHGTEPKIFKKFKKVFSGHYHTRSNDDSIFYLGNPYEMYWTDVSDDRGFHIFDTQTLEHTPVNNPHRIFNVIFYDNIDYQLFDARPYKNKIVKVIVRQKDDIDKFERFIDKLYSINVSELKIVENFDFSGWYDKNDDDSVESEDTISILDRYIEESEIELDKSLIQSMVREVYQEALDLV